jgi:hypothetical protein
MGFQGLDDLHRADLGRAGDGAARKTGPQQRRRILADREPAGDGADQMVDVGEALDGEQLRHAHAADLTGTAEIVAQQVHDHQVLGAVLGALR